MLKHKFLLMFLYVCAFIFSFAVVSVRLAAAQTDQRCFSETSQCISGRIREYWEQNGGLPVFGFPTTSQKEEQVEGKPFQVQWFERNRLELHPENAKPYDVLLGRLGVGRLEQQSRNWTNFAKVTSAPVGCQFFAETGHAVCEPFLSYFKNNGLEFDGQPGKSYAESLALFGLPVSEPAVETNSTGATVTTQWFERARFENHPENQPPYNVLLGLLGNEIRANTVVNPPPTTNPPNTPPATVEACKDVPASKDAELYPSQCYTAGSIIFANIFGFKGGEQVGFWLNNPSGQVVVGTRKTLQIGDSGRVNNLPLFTGSTPGVWSWVFQGTTSNHQSIIYIKVQEEADATLHITDTTASGKAGDTVTLKARTAPNAKCGIDYFTPLGDESPASGLDDKTADAQGNISWDWQLSASGGKGTGYVAVTCNNFTAWREIAVS